MMPCALPAVQTRDLEALVTLAGRSLLPIRSCTFAHTLVKRACFDLYGLPDQRKFGRWADVQWTNQVLNSRSGYFIATSVAHVERRGPECLSLHEVPAIVRMLTAATWTVGEAVEVLRDVVLTPDPSDTYPLDK